MALLSGGAGLWFRGGLTLRDDLWRLAFGFFVAYGFDLALTGIFAARCSMSAIYAGLGMTHIIAIVGLIALNFTLIALATALIFLAYRTLRLAEDPGPEAGSREVIVEALPRARAGRGVLTLKSISMAVTGLCLGGAIGGMAGFWIGGIGTFLAIVARLMGAFYGLAVLGGAFLGALGGAGGGAVGGIVAGATLGTSNGRINAMILFSGTSAAIVVVGRAMIGSPGFDWVQLNSWRDILFPILLPVITGAPSAVLGGLPVRYIARIVRSG
jgi:hypothetical protein